MFAKLIALFKEAYYKRKGDPLFQMKGLSFDDACDYRLAHDGNCGLCWMDMLVFKDDNAPPEVLERLKDWRVIKKKWLTVNDINYMVNAKYALPATDVSFDVQVVAEGVIHLVLRDDMAGYTPSELMKQLHGKVMIG